MRFQAILTILSLSLTFASSATISSNDSVPVETKSLDELYQLALAEGGNLIIKAGGDEKSQQDGVVSAFKTKFPGMNITTTVDLSKYHDSVIDRTFNLSGNAGADVAHLQTLHDFPRWKQEGRLLAYKPSGWEEIDDSLKDVDGYYVSIYYPMFSNNFATTKTTQAEAPKEFLDYLGPKWKGKIVSTYPNDDDAVLFQFVKIAQTHRWDAIKTFIAQDIQWVRGTATPATVILSPNSTRSVSFTTTSSYANGDSGIAEQLPNTDFSNTVIWAQRAAIFETAEHPAAAKLYLNWLLSKDQQTANGGWSVRSDVPTPEGLKPLSEYAGKLDSTAFETFMLDRPLVERWRLQFEQLIGTAQGLSPLEDDL